MKKVIVLIGPNGVGKSTTAEIFMQKHAKCAYIDSMNLVLIQPICRQKKS